MEQEALSIAPKHYTPRFMEEHAPLKVRNLSTIDVANCRERLKIKWDSQAIWDYEKTLVTEFSLAGTDFGPLGLDDPWLYAFMPYSDIEIWGYGSLSPGMTGLFEVSATEPYAPPRAHIARQTFPGYVLEWQGFEQKDEYAVCAMHIKIMSEVRVYDWDNQRCEF